MSTGSLQVFVDVGEQYNVIVDTSDAVVVSDQGSFYAVADFATTATTASYVLLTGVDGFSEYSASVSQEIAGTISGSGFTPLSVFNSFTSSMEERVNTLVSKTGSYATTGSNTFVGDQTITGSVSLSSDGLLIFTPRETPTSSIAGALFYSSSGELYVGM